MNKDLKAQREKDEAVFEERVKTFKSEFPDFETKEYTLSHIERVMLAQQSTIESLAANAQQAIINEICLRRVGYEPSPTLQVQYHVGLGRFVVFSPKEPKK